MPKQRKEPFGRLNHGLAQLVSELYNLISEAVFYTVPCDSRVSCKTQLQTAASCLSYHPFLIRAQRGHQKPSTFFVPVFYSASKQ